MGARADATSVLKYVEHLDLSNYPDIREQELDDLLILKIIDRLWHKAKVSVEFRHFKFGDEESLQKSSRISVYHAEQNLANIWAIVDGLSNAHFYLLHVHSETIEYQNDVRIDLGERYDVSLYRNPHVCLYGFPEALIAGQEIQTWLGQLADQARAVQKAKQPKRRIRIPLIWK